MHLVAKLSSNGLLQTHRWLEKVGPQFCFNSMCLYKSKQEIYAAKLFLEYSFLVNLDFTIHAHLSILAHNLEMAVIRIFIWGGISSDLGLFQKKTPGGGKKTLFFLPNHPWNSISSDTNHPWNSISSDTNHPSNQKVPYTNYP